MNRREFFKAIVAAPVAAQALSVSDNFSGVIEMDLSDHDDYCNLVEYNYTLINNAMHEVRWYEGSKEARLLREGRITLSANITGG